MDVPLIVAGSLAILGAAVHGVGGEVLVVRKLSPGMLPSSRFGGPGMTKAMIHVTWHMTALAVGLGTVYTRSPRSLLRHPGPAVLTATAALAWWGAL